MSAAILLPQRHATVLNCTWVAILLLLGTDAAWLVHAGIGFPIKTLTLIAAASALLSVISFIYRRIRKDEPIWLASQIVNQLVLGSCALGTFNYLGLLLNYPLVDGKLVAADEWLGFDWAAYIGWVNQHAQVAHILTLAYITTGPEVLIILALLLFFKRFTQAYRYALSYLLGGFITILIGNFWPATAAYIYKGISPSQYSHLKIAEASAYSPEFFAMRAHTLDALPQTFQGLVAFPSFHSALAVFAMAAALAMPSRMLAAFIIVINMLMLLATPVDGGHYLVDTLSGILTALVVIAIVARVMPGETRGDAIASAA